MGSAAVIIRPAPFPGGSHKRRTKSGCSLFCLLGQFFSVSAFVFSVHVHVMFCFLVFGCQYQCNRLPGKMSEMTFHASSGTLNSTHSLTKSSSCLQLGGHGR